MDFTSMSFAIIAAVIAAIGLWWHVILAKRGIATTRDRMLGGVWAAVFVLALGRILWITSNGTAPKPAPATPVAPASLPK
ncbi:MAG: hypothetical protein K8T90_20365 [Planctomycetes bacterium]|nr:hypothetical protein [Planctomycetota bacterium]